MEKSPEEINKLVVHFKEWILSQGNLPKDLDDTVIRRFLHSCYYETEAARKTVELFFSIRAASPELFIFRDPDTPQMQKAFKIVNLAQYTLSGNKNVWMWQLNDPGLDNFDYTQDVRLFFLSLDAWLINNDHYSDTDIVVLDVKDISLKFITKFNVSLAKKLSKFQEEAMPIRLKGVHVINTPPFIDKLFNLMKPFLKQQIIDMIHFHTPNSETLYKYINKEDLPVDYGGFQPSMSEFMNRTISAIEAKKHIIMSDNFWKTDKKGKSSTETGTFRTLDID